MMQHDHACSLSNATNVLQILKVASDLIDTVEVYRHENGFVKVPVSLSRTTQIRVHVWDRGSRRDTASLHSHRHPISSRVVSGALEEDRWVPAAAGRTYRRYDFTPGTPGSTELVESGFIALTRRQRSVWHVDDVYSMPISEFHCAAPVELPVVTIFKQDLRERGEGCVASERPLRVFTRPDSMLQNERREILTIIKDSASSLSKRCL